jgi:hypothetical protein
MMRADYLEPNSGVSNSMLKIKRVVADITLTTEDSGSVILCNPTATTEITLPTPVSGWHCKVVITEDTDGSDGGMNQITNIAFGSYDVVGHIHASDGAAGDYAVDNDDYMNFTADASPGDSVDIFTDGARWYVNAFCENVSDGDVVFHTAAAT